MCINVARLVQGLFECIGFVGGPGGPKCTNIMTKETLHIPPGCTNASLYYCGVCWHDNLHMCMGGADCPNNGFALAVNMTISGGYLSICVDCRKQYATNRNKKLKQTRIYRCKICRIIVPVGSGALPHIDGVPVPGVYQYDCYCQECWDLGKLSFACNTCDETDVMMLLVLNGRLVNKCCTCEAYRAAASTANLDGSRYINYLIVQASNSQVSRRHIGWQLGPEAVRAEMTWSVQDILSRVQECGSSLRRVGYNGEHVFPFTVSNSLDDSLMLDRIDEDTKNGYKFLDNIELAPRYMAPMYKIPAYAFVNELAYRERRFSEEELFNIAGDIVRSSFDSESGVLYRVGRNIVTDSETHPHKFTMLAPLLERLGRTRIGEICTAFVAVQCVRQGARCIMTGLPFAFFGDTSVTWRKPSPDRIDWDGPYCKSNVEIVAVACNLPQMNLGGLNRRFPVKVFEKSTLVDDEVHARITDSKTYNAVSLERILSEQFAVKWGGLKVDDAIFPN